MASSKELTILINAKDNASREITGVNKALSGIASAAKTAAVAIGAVAGGFAYVLKETTDASNELNNALIGLNSVAGAFKQDTDKAKQAAVELASDGLMSVKDAANGLKNLLATGFSLPEAIKLMYAFKDAAAFNRQGTLEFGQAIEGATQGIKNQNSILVDNAGITKNLSIILKEAGMSQNDLMNVTSDATVRQALYNGILKEASIFQGDAARMADTLSGRQAALATQIFMVKAAIGEALSPVMQIFIDQINLLIQQVGGPEGIKMKMMEYQDELMAIAQASMGIIKIVGWMIEAFFKLADVLGTIIFKMEQLYNLIKKFKDKAGIAGDALFNMIGGPGFNLGSIFRAAGGPVTSGSPYIVGEQGPELFVPSSGGSIVPNNKLGGGLVINITGNTLLDSRAAEKIGDMLVQKLALSAKL